MAWWSPFRRASADCRLSPGKRNFMNANADTARSMPGSSQSTSSDLQGLFHTQRAAFVAEGPVTLKVREVRLERSTAILLRNRQQQQYAITQAFGTRGREWSEGETVGEGKGWSGR